MVKVNCSDLASARLTSLPSLDLKVLICSHLISDRKSIIRNFNLGAYNYHCIKVQQLVTALISLIGVLSNQN